MSKYNSNWVFKLASDFGIPLNAGAVSPMTDDEFECFRIKYKELSRSRDLALYEHTIQRPSLFRVYLPYSGHSFGIANQIAWYLDEVVIRDPIPSILDELEGNLEVAKYELRKALQVMAHFRGLIENEYVLLAGPTTLDKIPDEPSPSFMAIFSDENLRREIEKISRWGYSESEDGTGVAHDVRFLTGYEVYMTNTVEIPPGCMWKSPTIDMEKGFPNIDYQALSKKLGKDPVELHLSLFFKEMQRPIFIATNAQKMGSAVLFPEFWPIYERILQKAEIELRPDRQNASIQALNIALPFVDGIPPDKLMDVRRSSPTAFVDFRSRVADILLEATGEETPSVEYLRHRVSKEVLPTLGSLDHEMKGALKRAGITGIGAPLVAGTGVLIGNILGVPAHILLGTALTGAAAGLSALADAAQITDRAKGHPGYFLWKANKLKK